MSEPLHTAILLVRLEQAVNETAGRFKWQMALVAGLFAIFGISFAAIGSWGTLPEGRV